MSLQEFKEKNGYEIENYWLPRVTSITDVVFKPGLLRYYAQQPNFFVAQQTLNHAANWGTNTHEAVEKFLIGEECEIDPIILPSIQAFKQWKKEYKAKILDVKNDVERRVYDIDDRYAGTLDALVEIDGILGVLDIKTGSGIWDEYSLQLAAYMNAYNKSVPSKRMAKTRWILRLDQFEECKLCGAKKRVKGGKVIIRGGKISCYHKFLPARGEFEFKELKDFNHDIDGFIGAKRLWEWYNKSHLKQIENYPKTKIIQALL
jgi:hypothetical protein